MKAYFAAKSDNNPGNAAPWSIVRPRMYQHALLQNQDVECPNFQNQENLVNLETLDC